MRCVLSYDFSMQKVNIQRKCTDSVAVYGNVMNGQNVMNWCREFSGGRTDVHYEQMSGRPSLISDRRQTSMTRGYRNCFQNLINVWTMLATMLKNKVMYRQFIHSVAFVN